MTYKQHREKFVEFRARLLQNKSIQKDIESAFSELLGSYCTTIYENRFLAGGVCEQIVAAAFDALGFDVKLMAAANMRVDLRINNLDYSIKGRFRGSSGDIRLINSLGDATQRKWEEATILAISKIGLIYVDPDLLPDATKSNGDAIVLKWSRVLNSIKAHPELVIPMNIPESTRDTAESKVASVAVAREILSKTANLKLVD